MIDPSDVINYARTPSELQEWWLFSIVVAGKTAVTQARLLDVFLKALPGRTPFGKLRRAEEEGKLYQALIDSRLGQYNRIHRAFVESLHLDLRNDPLERLEQVHGVGPKTARMFLMHSRKDQQYAALDTHILKFLRSRGHDAPLNTPSPGPKYRALEEAFLGHAKKAGMTPAAFDLSIWNSYGYAA